ncbi:GTP-binding protein, partial [bacterium]
MKRFETDKIRNVALAGQGGSGKTSLAEAMLFVSGATKRLGKVDDQNSILDYDPEEKSHRLTISTGVASFEHQKHKITLLDTPGYDVFLFDGMGALHAAEAVVLVAGADSEVKFEAEKMWAQAQRLELPRIVAVTKLDKENTSFDKVMDSLARHFEANFVRTMLPIGSGSSFKGYVDLVKNKAFTFADDSGKAQ